MKSLNTISLMLGILAVGGLIGGAYFTTQAYATSPVNAATAANSDDDSVTQSNSARTPQSADTKCRALVSDNDVAQEGSDTNTASNDCDSTQSASTSQSNTNTDNDVQTAIAEACQIALGSGDNNCGNTEEEE